MTTATSCGWPPASISPASWPGRAWIYYTHGLRQESLNKIKANVEANASRPAPKWLDYDANNMVGKVVAMPARDDIDLPVEEHLIIELYSK